MGTIGENIVRIRKEKGLTQRQLAEKIGTSPQNIFQYEKDMRSPRLDTARKLAAALEVPVTALFDINSLIVKMDTLSAERNRELSDCTFGSEEWQFVVDKYDRELSRIQNMIWKERTCLNILADNPGETDETFDNIDDVFIRDESTKIKRELLKLVEKLSCEDMQKLLDFGKLLVKAAGAK